jgi:hypothetical protein
MIADFSAGIKLPIPSFFHRFFDPLLVFVRVICVIFQLSGIFSAFLAVFRLIESIWDR